MIDVMDDTIGSASQMWVASERNAVHLSVVCPKRASEEKNALLMCTRRGACACAC